MPAPLAGPDPFPAWSRRLAASDPDALEELFHAMHDQLLRYVGALVRDDATARDAVQETFIRVWERRATLDPARSLRALLFRTARNLALNQLRDSRTRAQLLAAGAYEAAGQVATPDELTAAEDLGRQLRRWIDELPDRQREALTLSRFEGLSHDEIAEVMDVAPRTVNNHLVRALLYLRQRMAGVDANPAAR